MTEADDAPSLFFAGSDDEDTAMVIDTDEPKAESSTVAEKRLFLPAESDDDDVPMIPQKRGSSPDVHNDDLEPMDTVEMPRARSVSASSMSEYISISSDSDEEAGPSSKKKGQKPPPTKKRRLSPSVATPDTIKQPIYIGEFVIPNAWSTMAGSGYVKINDVVRIEREEDNSKKDTKGKQKDGNTKTNSGKKQMSLASMLKAQPAKASKSSKKKVDTIVRLVTTRDIGERVHSFILDASTHTFHRIWKASSGSCLVGREAARPRFVPSPCLNVGSNFDFQGLSNYEEK